MFNYMYDSTVFEIINHLKPSGRGELEITEVNNAYIREGTLTYDAIDGWWIDAGTFEAIYQANEYIHNHIDQLSRMNTGYHGIARRSGSIGRRKTREQRIYLATYGMRFFSIIEYSW